MVAGLQINKTNARDYISSYLPIIFMTHGHLIINKIKKACEQAAKHVIFRKYLFTHLFVCILGFL